MKPKTDEMFRAFVLDEQLNNSYSLTPLDARNTHEEIREWIDNNCERGKDYVILQVISKH